MSSRMQCVLLSAGLLLSLTNRSWPQDLEVLPVASLGPQQELSPEFLSPGDFPKYLLISLLHQKLRPDTRSFQAPTERVWMLAESRLAESPDFSVGLYSVYDDTKSPAYRGDIIIVREFSAPRGKSSEKSVRETAPERIEVGDPKRNEATAQSLKQSLDQIEDTMKGLEVLTCQIPIAEVSAARLASVWTEMLRRTRYDNADNPDAGSGVHFGASPYFYRFYHHYLGMDFFNQVSAVGVAGWANDEAKPGLMVGSALALRDYCKTKDKKYLTILTQKLDALEKRLPKGAPN